VRTLESVYWHGARILRGDTGALSENGDCVIEQWDPYVALDEASGAGSLPPAEDALVAAAESAESNGLDGVSGVTRLLIVPGYPFRTYASGVDCSIRASHVFVLACILLLTLRPCTYCLFLNAELTASSPIFISHAARY
jgi:hypothetical protein